MPANVHVFLLGFLSACTVVVFFRKDQESPDGVFDKRRLKQISVNAETCDLINRTLTTAILPGSTVLASLFFPRTTRPQRRHC